jgi:topoisomerase-4 subunit A
MTCAEFDSVAADIETQNKVAVFHAVGSTRTFDGFMKVYTEDKDDEEDKKESKSRLMDRFNLTETQAEAIVMLHLYRLSSTNIEDLQNEFNSLNKTVASLEALLHNDKKLRKKLAEELEEVYKAHPSTRLSVIEDEIQEFVVEKKAIIKEEVRISITRDGYFKRSSLKSYVSSGEDSLPAIKGGDIFIGTSNAFTTDTILAFTDKGNYLYIPVYELIDNNPVVTKQEIHQNPSKYLIQNTYIIMQH